MQLGEQTFCFFGKNSTLKGDFELHGQTHINCKVYGHLNVVSEEVLSIGPESYIEGDITAFNIDIYGEVRGDITASNILRIFPSAVVEGKVSAKSLIIKPGAIINMTGHTRDL